MKMNLADANESVPPPLVRNVANEDGEVAAQCQNEKPEAQIADILGELLEGEAGPIVALALAQLESA